MASRSKTLVAVLVSVVVLGALGTVAVSFILLRALGDFGGSGEWSSTAIAERDLPYLYGVKLPVAPLVFDGRAMGFQDGYWEVLVKLPPSSREAFLSMNAVTTNQERRLSKEALARIQELEPGTPPLTATGLDLPPPTRPDGGGWMLSRRAALLEGEGVLWLHFIAHES